MNETAIAERGVQPLVTFLGNITESFPVMPEEHKNASRFDTADHEAFSNTYLYFAQHSIFPFLTIDVDSDPEDVVCILFLTLRKCANLTGNSYPDYSAHGCSSSKRDLRESRDKLLISEGDRGSI